MKEEKLFGWNPVRRFLRFDEAPYDDSGNELTLWNGADVPSDTTIHLVKPRKGKLHDFLYFPGLLLFVSERVLEVLQSANVPNIRVNWLNIRDRDGRLINDSYYWVNVRQVVPLLDLERSIFTRRLEGDWLGGISNVKRLVILENSVPADDLFLFKELALAVFKEPLVNAIQAAGLTGAKFEPLDETFTWPV